MKKKNQKTFKRHFVAKLRANCSNELEPNDFCLAYSLIVSIALVARRTNSLSSYDSILLRKTTVCLKFYGFCASKICNLLLYQ